MLLSALINISNDLWIVILSTVSLWLQDSIHHNIIITSVLSTGKNKRMLPCLLWLLLGPSRYSRSLFGPSFDCFSCQVRHLIVVYCIVCHSLYNCLFQSVNPRVSLSSSQITIGCWKGRVWPSFQPAVARTHYDSFQQPMIYWRHSVFAQRMCLKKGQHL